MTTITARILAAISARWPDPMAAHNANLGAEPGTKAYARAYAGRQFMTSVNLGGLCYPHLQLLWGKDVLDIGCGHGGRPGQITPSPPRRTSLSREPRHVHGHANGPSRPCAPRTHG